MSNTDLARITVNEQGEARRLIQKAIDSGQFRSVSQIGIRAGLGDTILYPIMRGTGGLGRTNFDRLRKYLAKFSLAAPVASEEQDDDDTPEEDAGAEMKGHAPETPPNGPGVASPAGRLGLTLMVVEKLGELRATSNDAALTSRIDQLVSRWGTEGLEILASAPVARAK